MSQHSDRAIRALERGATTEAIAIARDAGKDADALNLLANWTLGGRHLARDLMEARSLLRAASAAGSEDASLTEAALTANGTGAVKDWRKAVYLLRDAADRFGGPARDDLVLLDAMRIDDNGDPIDLRAPEILGKDYVIRRWRGFLTPAECAHVAMSVRDLLAPSVVADPRTGKLIDHPIRTSSAAVVGPTRETLPLQAILRRLAAATQTTVEQGEPLSVLHYAPGQQYRDHVDTLPHEPNQRIKTALMYLNSGYGGGETHFPLSRVSITPAGGDAIAFDNVLPDGTPDPRSRHAGVPVRQGTKWAATRWIRERPYDVWNPQ
jgi:prolyl 4-hydroxylase